MIRSDSRDSSVQQQGYDAFEHLYRSVFSQKTDWFLMLTAYLDDSGIGPDKSVAVVAGYLATVQKWENFNRLWATLLSDYAITQLRRSDLENFQGPYADWLPQRRKEFLQQAHAIIRDYTDVGIGFAAIKEDYNAVIPDDDPLKQYGFFSWCAYGCLANIRTWCEENHITQPIQIVFEAGTLGHGEVDRIIRNVHSDVNRWEHAHIRGWSFQGKEVVPLQAADTVAYEFQKFIDNKLVQHEKRPIRLSAKDLFREQDVGFLKYFDRNDLESFFQKWRSEDGANS